MGFCTRGLRRCMRKWLRPKVVLGVEFSTDFPRPNFDCWRKKNPKYAEDWRNLWNCLKCILLKNEFKFYVLLFKNQMKKWFLKKGYDYVHTSFEKFTPDQWKSFLVPETCVSDSWPAAIKCVVVFIEERERIGQSFVIACCYRFFYVLQHHIVVCILLRSLGRKFDFHGNSVCVSAGQEFGAIRRAGPATVSASGSKKKTIQTSLVD